MRDDMTIYETKNYKMFDLNEVNRPVDTGSKKFKTLLKLMREYGWLSARQMHVEKNGNGKLKIKEGHHRFVAAQTLGIPVKYSICNSGISIHDLEDVPPAWTLSDYLASYVRMGLPDYIVVKEYRDKTGIGLMNCIAILGGQTAGTTDKNVQFKQGKFQTGNMSNANKIEEIVLCLKQNGINFSAISSVIKAISRIVWVNGFSVMEMKKKINAHPYLIKKRPTLNSYLEMFEAIYNRGRKDKTPLAFLANEAAKERRRVILGPKNKTAKKEDLGGSKKGKR